MEGQATQKNAIINGNFDIWQRGTSQTTEGYGSDDRWKLRVAGSAVTHSRQTFTPGQSDVPNNPTYHSRNVITSVLDPSNNIFTQQKIEGVSTLAGETVTLSFWAKADAAKNIATEFVQQFGSGGSPSSSVTELGVTTHALTTSWKQFTVTLTLPSISGKTLGTDDNDFVQLNFWFDAGSNFDSRTNSLGQQSGTFDIAQVQIENGNTATDFENRSVGEELTLCQRYYQRLSGSFNFVGTGMCHSSAQWDVIISFAVMRTNPTVTVSNVSDFLLVNATGGGLAMTSITGAGASTSTSRMYGNVSSGLVAGNATLLYIINSGWIDFDAEL